MTDCIEYWHIVFNDQSQKRRLERFGRHQWVEYCVWTRPSGPTSQSELSPLYCSGPNTQHSPCCSAKSCRQVSNIYVQIDQRPANQWSNESRDNDRGGMAIIIIVLDLVLLRLWSLDLWLGPSPQHLTRPDAMAMPMAMPMAMAMAMAICPWAWPWPT